MHLCYCAFTFWSISGDNAIKNTLKLKLVARAQDMAVKNTTKFELIAHTQDMAIKNTANFELVAHAQDMAYLGQVLLILCHQYFKIFIFALFNRIQLLQILRKNKSKIIFCEIVLATVNTIHNQCMGQCTLGVCSGVKSQSLTLLTYSAII